MTGTAETADDFLDALAGGLPDVAVVDVRLPPTYRDEGLRAAVEARRRHPGLPVLVLSAHVEHSYALELLSGGGKVGYLLKERVGRVAKFLDALHRVVGGGTAIDSEVIAQLLTRRQRGTELKRLSNREREVLALMAEGQDNTEIAGSLAVSDTAVAKHIRNVFAKLDLQQSEGGHRRVPAVLAYLQGAPR
ncbi:Two-component system, response regulator of the LuxR family [Saccharothrix espanaensis DSM 44229]|uniref:Two-component system, response regulator of the LuxR family n=1 Tax=Saccharothrix espanaensis (strain ATCC 51144 / DSM 44229 / JCM 9112 / NBRC 15066 / NRRL 15764) TaxID=1179773 RepID=K0JV28_SACES|nr:Two-component system, response regulator of the LuxR family [Saccharothrix espanaensis DSM 44229]